jgi:phosphotriesterase-related protein
MTPTLATTSARTDRSFVRTVRGDIGPAEVGFTHCHEHVFILPGASCRLDGDLLLDDLDKTTAELREFFAAEGRTVVDAQPIGPERAPTLQRLANERSGVNIVATTGFHRAIYYRPDHFRFRKSADVLAERLIREITEGMAQYDDAEAVRATDIRAGLLKFASDYHVINANAQKAAEAVAAAHAATGAPILTHTEHGTCGLEQVELFAKLGVPPSALLLSHLDRNPDIFLHDEITQTGAYVVYDGISRAKRLPDSTIVGLICRLVESGRASRILLGMDMARRSMWRSYGGGPGMTYLGNVFLRRLRQAGMGVEQIRMFTEYNPAAALSFRDQPA